MLYYCFAIYVLLERCNPWPHVANRQISISQLLSLWRHSHYDVICYWAGHAQRDGRTYVRTYVYTDTFFIPRLILRLSRWKKRSIFWSPTFCLFSWILLIGDSRTLWLSKSCRHSWTIAKKNEFLRQSVSTPWQTWWTLSMWDNYRLLNVRYFVLFDQSLCAGNVVHL